MATETRKQIVEQTRNAVAKQYNKEIEFQKKRIKKLCEELEETKKELYEVKCENGELKDKLTQLEDWNNRLQEFMDMNPDEREYQLVKIRADKELQTHLAGIINMYEKMFML